MAEGPPPSEAGSSKTVGEVHASYQPQLQPYFSQQVIYYPGYQYAWPSLANHAQANPHPQYYHHQPPPQPPPLETEERAFEPVSPISQPQPQPQASPLPQPQPTIAERFHNDWDAVIKSFLSAAGLTQALRGFEADMVILNPGWEREKVPDALGELLNGLLHLGKDVEESEEERSLDERKLDYVHVRGGVQPRSQSSINKEISMFLARNRARNNESDRNEFLTSLDEKRRRLNEEDHQDPENISSCARTDAKPVDRDLQMKYDIAKNDEGPLRKTVKQEGPSLGEDASSGVQGDEDGLLSARHPGLDKRLADIETHLAVRYVPSQPRLIIDRIKFLEDHIVSLEKEYPPWAALHFNQPNRGWPPPPRPTPVIVPPRMLANPALERDSLPSENGKGKKSKATTSRRGRGSSLHRAVMERLEVQKAKNDLAHGVGMDVDQDIP